MYILNLWLSIYLLWNLKYKNKFNWIWICFRMNLKFIWVNLFIKKIILKYSSDYCYQNAYILLENKTFAFDWGTWFFCSGKYGKKSYLFFSMIFKYRYQNLQFNFYLKLIQKNLYQVIFVFYYIIQTSIYSPLVFYGFLKLT